MRTREESIMAKRLMCSWALGLLVFVGAVATHQGARAQEVQVTGPLAGAPAVRHLRIYREGRVMLQPTVGFSLQDQFTRYISFGLQANYHFTDWLGIGLWGFYAPVQLQTGLTTQVSQFGATTSRNRLSLPTSGNFSKQIGSLDWVVALQGIFIPLRGKLALFQEVFLDADFYVVAGVALAGVTERANTDPTGMLINPCAGDTVTDACLESQTARSSRLAVAPMFGVGLSVFANHFISVALEWRAFPFNWNTSGTDERGRNAQGQVRDASGGNVGGVFPDGRVDGQDALFQFNHQFSLGVAFYLPTEARRTE